MVETAVVCSVYLLVLFGVVEYSRFLFFLQLTQNAAREGCRYAVVNTEDSTLTADTQTVVNNYMNNMGSKMGNFTVQVFEADSNCNNVGLPQNTPFGSNICVEITYNYSPILPSFLRMNATIPITIKEVMCSEAN
jgi:TadE-like protein